MEAPRSSKRRRTSSAEANNSHPRDGASAVAAAAATSPAARAAPIDPELSVRTVSPLRDVRSPSAYPYSGVRASPSVSTSAALPATHTSSSRLFASSSSSAVNHLQQYQQQSHSRSSEPYLARSPSTPSAISQLHHVRHHSPSRSAYPPYASTGAGASHYPHSHPHPHPQFHSHALSQVQSNQSGDSSSMPRESRNGNASSGYNSPQGDYSPPQAPNHFQASPSSAGHRKAERVSSPVEVDKVKAETPGGHRDSSNEKPRGGQACLECRLAKVRCLPSPDSESCQRCQRFNFDCLFVQHKRGRKPKSKLQGRDLTLLAEAASATPASAVSATASGTPGPSSHNSGHAQHARSRSTTPVGKIRRPESVAAPFPNGVESPITPVFSRPGRAMKASTLDRLPTSASSPRIDFSGEDLRQSRLAGSMTAGGDPVLDPKRLYGVDVHRMARAMQQAMTSQDRRRGTPYTLVTSDNASTESAANDEASAAGTPPPPDTNAINESFELIAEQPLTMRLMLKPFIIADNSTDDVPRPVLDDRKTLGASQTEIDVDDPITNGTVTEAAARALYDIYMAEANAWGQIFDPSLQTHDFVRKRSSFLYTTLLYVASRFCRTPTAQHLIARKKRGEPVREEEWDIAYPSGAADKSPEAAEAYAEQIRRELHMQVRSHGARAFVDGDRTVLCCQAFFILASWKMPDDGLSVIQVGYAFRLAMDIQLHADLPECVKPNEPTLDQAGQQRYAAVQRRFRSRQRTFMMLFVQDKTQQIANKITTHSISPDNPLIRKCQEWWRAPGAVPGDVVVCASVDIRRIQHKYVDLIDRVEQLSGPMSDGPSVVLPAFLNDIAEWFQRWTSVLDVKKDLDEVPFGDDSDTYTRKFHRTLLKIWRDSLKTYVASLALKSTLKKAAQLEHQELMRTHGRRSATAGTEDRDSISGRSSLMRNGCVNLMNMAAFWPCVEGARGVLENLISLPPERLQTAPDATMLQSTHAAVLLCSLATLKSNPPLGQGYLRTAIQLVDQASAAFRQASISTEDTACLIAQYLESLLRPKDAGEVGPGPNGSGQTGDGTNAVPIVLGNPVFGASSSFYTGLGQGGGGGSEGGAALRNVWDASVASLRQQPATHASSFFSNGHLAGLDPGSHQEVEGGLNTIAAAAAAVAAATASGASMPAAPASMDIGNLTWPTTSTSTTSIPSEQHQHQHQQQPPSHHQAAQYGWPNADAYQWNPLMFNQSAPVLQSEQSTDETLQMLLRFLE